MKPPILELRDFIADPVKAADFPAGIERHRNDPAAQSVGLEALSDADWKRHFWAFEPLPGNLPEPLALRYHGHQFGTYNPDLGDGRGFLFAQLRDDGGRWLDLGTKGTGETPWSRRGDGRLTLKGGVREVLASAMLEALGVNTSKAFSLFETGEELTRGDEPSPTRSSVLVRLSHSHLRFGTFQRLAALDQRDNMVALIRHCCTHYYPGAARDDPAEMAAALLGAIVPDTACMVASWMAAGFVHGVMNTDNFNLTGETFDFGPYRFLPVSDPNFTAAYFDHTGLYRFGAQPGRGLWNLQQLASALTLVTGEDTKPLVDALSTYERHFQRALVSALHARLGIAETDFQSDLSFAGNLFAWMTETGVSWPGFLHDAFCGALSETRIKGSPRAATYADPAFEPIRNALFARDPVRTERLDHEVFQTPEPVSLLIDEIEALWDPIAEADDWSLYQAKLDDIEQLRRALDLTPPRPDPS